jgi:large subunit ribosomal protein L20
MRIKPGVAKRRRLKRILKDVKGYRSARRKRIKLAKEAVLRAGRESYTSRKLRRRSMRRLWITRLSAATRAKGLTYSRFVNGLKKAGIEVDRKQLATVAYKDGEAFERFVEMAKAVL